MHNNVHYLEFGRVNPILHQCQGGSRLFIHVGLNFQRKNNANYIKNKK